MKKNLKIVSAAAAALLAVAPVVATGVVSPVSAAQPINFDGSGSTIKIATPTVNEHTVNISTSVHATGYTNSESSAATPATQVPSTVAGTITLSVNGKEVQAVFGNNSVNSIWNATQNADGTVSYGSMVNKETSGANKGRYLLNAGGTYVARLDNVYLNVGANYYRTHSDHKIDLETTDGTQINLHDTASTNTTHTKVSVSPTGEVKIKHLTTAPFKATDPANKDNVSFYEKSTGNKVTTGSVDLNANSDKQLNVSDVVDAINNKYAAETIDPQTGVQTGLGVKTDANDVAQQLNKAGINVASNGEFTVPANGEFTLNFESAAAGNGKTAKLAVTVNVPNVKSTHVDEYAHTTRVWNKKASYIYNDKHVRQGNNIMYKIGSGHNVVANADGTAKEYTIAGGVKAYKLADGYYKGDYVDVRNFQTTRVHVNNNHKTAKVRSRVFDVRGKAVKHMYIEKGATVRVYGTKTIKGHKMYKIAKHNRYVKVANF